MVDNRTVTGMTPRRARLRLIRHVVLAVALVVVAFVVSLPLWGRAVLIGLAVLEVGFTVFANNLLSRYIAAETRPEPAATAASPAAAGKKPANRTTKPR